MMQDLLPLGSGNIFGEVAEKDTQLAQCNFDFDDKDEEDVA